MNDEGKRGEDAKLGLSVPRRDFQRGANELCYLVVGLSENNSVYLIRVYYK